MLAIVGLAASLWLLSPSPPCAADNVTEHELKAVFLINFTLYVDWPSEAFADANAPFVMAIVGKHHFGRALDLAVKGETYRKRRIVVRYLDRLEAVSELDGSQLVYIARSEAPRLGALAKAAANAPMLTVSDIRGFARSGGIIEMGVERGRLALTINQTRAQAGKLKISSKLLRIARRVVQGHPENTVSRERADRSHHNQEAAD